MFVPRYKISNRLLRCVGLVEAAREVIGSASLVPTWEERFREEAMIRVIHFGTQVEGNELSLEQVERVIGRKAERDVSVLEMARVAGVLARERDVQEAINYRSALKHFDGLLEEYFERGGRFEYTQKQLLQIHALMMERLIEPHKLGVYRQEQVVIRGVKAGEVIYRPPNAVEVPYQIDDLFVWLNGHRAGEVHAVIKAGIVHFELARIHPFVGGNGKVARIMSWLVIAVEGVDTRRLISVEEYFNRNAEAYYDAFIGVFGDGSEMTGWLEFFAEAVAVEMEKVKERVRKLSVDSRLRGKTGRQIALKERQIRLIEYLETREWATMAEVRKVLPMVSDDTILRDLKDLMRKGLVKKRGKTKGARYSLKVSQ